MFKRLAGLIPFVVLLAACGSGGDDHTPTAGTGGTGGTGGTSTDPVYSLGSGTGSAFQAGAIGASSTNLSAGASTTLSVSIVDQTGVLFTSPVTVTFSSACIGQNLATVTSPVSTSTGVVTTTYVAKGCNGTDVVTASASAGGQSLVANVSLNIAPGEVGSIVFESATPQNIALRGAGDADRPETSTVVFRVLDQSGGPRVGADVQFVLNTTVGGLTLAPASAQSDATGRVQTVVQAGTVSSTVRVTATVTSTSPIISAQSNQLTVTTGIPDQDSFSLAVQCQNVEAWAIDGVQVPVTARLSDRFNNPVPNGTAVTLTAEGGSIQSQCPTGSTDTQSGFCTVNWTSSNPRPGGGLGQSGRVSLLATAIGEESFTDNNGNGTFDNGENFADIAERFRDENENDTYEVGEFIYDFNNNSTRDPGDGIFNGVLCLDTTGRCDTTKKTTGIAASNLIIMSDGVPNRVSPANGTTLATLSRSDGSNSYSFRFADLNDNPMPAETTIEASVVGTGLGVAVPAKFTVPCTSTPTTYSFTVTASATAINGTGTLRITVTSPGGAGVNGIQTVLNYPFPVGS